MMSDEAKRYLEKAKGLPFFYVVGKEEYAAVLSELQQAGVLVDNMSMFCPHDDKMPALDAMIDHFRMADIDYARNKHVLIGLGEYLSLKGIEFAKNALRKLSVSTLGNARVILLLRGVTSQVKQLVEDDPRLMAQQRVTFAETEEPEFSVICVKKNLAKTDANGLKELLQAFEKGETHKTVCTGLEFPFAMMKVSKITTSFDAIRKRLSVTDSLEEEMGTEDQWEMMLKELEANGNSLDAVFERYGVSEDSESDIYRKITDLKRFKAWLYFIFLKVHSEDLKNKYLQYVLKATNKAEDLKDNILLEIIHIPRTNRFFKTYYESRKKLIRDFSEAEFALFVQKNKIDIKEAIYRYTDTTFTEREEIIKWVAKNGRVPELDDIYPALDLYLKNYQFKCGAMSEMFTNYFGEYRIQKLVNKLCYPEFLKRVEKNAESPAYLKLDHRDSALLQVSDKQNSCLCWVDALGVEYLAYITERARQRDLSIQIKIVRAELPTITSINRKFYDEWSGKIKYKVSDLDEIKHKEKGGYDYRKTKAPIHLARELEVIDRVVDEAYGKLMRQECSSFIIASDHGASRLAVIKEQEEKYPTDTKGEHSGRCCKEFDGAILDHAIHENGYIVLTDYGRFAGSHAANVEVHGGGSLEEVVVPVITLTRKKYSRTEIKLLNENKIYADRHAGTVIELYISRVENPEQVGLLLGGKFYVAKSEDETHYTIILDDVKRASKKLVTATVCDGDDEIGEINFEVKSKVAKINDDFNLI